MGTKLPLDVPYCTSDRDISSGYIEYLQSAMDLEGILKRRMSLSSNYEGLYSDLTARLNDGDR